MSEHNPHEFRKQLTLMPVLQDLGIPDTLRAAAERSDARLLEPVGTAQAAARFDEFSGADAVVLVLTRDEPEALDGLLVALDAAAESSARGLIVLLPTALIDVVATRAPGAELLVDADAADFDAALNSVPTSTHGLNDASRDEKASHLRDLSEEVGRIARRLAALSGPSAELAPADGASTPSEADAAMLRAAIRSRRLREQFFPSELFADPAWDILLDLTAARIERRQVAVSSLCIAAAVPPTTALRHIKMMTEQKLLRRVADPQDGRRVFVELTDPAAAAMNNYLAAMRRNGGMAV